MLKNPINFSLWWVLVYLSKHSKSIIGLFGNGFSAKVVNPTVAKSLNDFGRKKTQKGANYFVLVLGKRWRPNSNVESLVE